MDANEELQNMLKTRRETHGDFEEFSEVAQSLKNEMRDTVGWAKLNNSQREALDMIAHKIARILTGDPSHKDHWDDIAGYAQRGGQS